MPACRWTGKKATHDFHGNPVAFITCGGRTTAYAPALQKKRPKGSGSDKPGAGSTGGVRVRNTSKGGGVNGTGAAEAVIADVAQAGAQDGEPPVRVERKARVATTKRSRVSQRLEDAPQTRQPRRAAAAATIAASVTTISQCSGAGRSKARRAAATSATAAIVSVAATSRAASKRPARTRSSSL